MSAARHMIALLKSHLEGDDKEFLSVAMQAAAHEARLGHGAIEQQLRDLIDEAKRRSAAAQTRPGQLIVLEPRGELANLLSVQTPTIRLADMAMPSRCRRGSNACWSSSGNKNGFASMDFSPAANSCS